MSGIMQATFGGGGISITVGERFVFSPKTGATDQWGYTNIANSIDGVAAGAVIPTTLMGATINGIFSIDDTSVPGTFRLILNGNQTSLSITSAKLYSSTISLGAPSFSGGQTTWTGTMPSVGATFWATTPVNATFS